MTGTLGSFVRRGVLAATAVTVCAGSAGATITSYSATLESHWPTSTETPLVGSASVALDDSTNKLSWEVQWAGSSARRARVTMIGPSACAGTACAPEARLPIVLDLDEDESTVDVRGGELSGVMDLTPEQAARLGAASEAWRVELRLWDKRGVQLQGQLKLEMLPPGLWL